MANLLNRTLLKKSSNGSYAVNRGFEVHPAAPSRFKGRGPISIIDIGSNSVRLVTFERLNPASSQIFNEKALCGLGKGLSQSGSLNQDAVEAAIAAIHRFKVLSDQMEAQELHIIATAAAREASNGAEFIERVAEISGVEPQVLTGEDEARYSAYGIISGIYDANGIMGDMGGGSLELANVKNRQIGAMSTDPLGALRLIDNSDASPSKAAKLCASTLKDSAILETGEDRNFYAIGGTWRSLAMLHIHQNNYPLHVLHNYTVDAKEMMAFCKSVYKSDLDKLDSIQIVSKSRRPLIQYGAALLSEILEKMCAKAVVFSAIGVREGFLYDLLDEEEREEDAMLYGALELSTLRSRSPQNALELIDWTTDLFQSLNILETDEERRMRQAACLLSDVGWRAHPDYRSEQSVNMISHAAFTAVTHTERAFMGMTSWYRHNGTGDSGIPKVAGLMNTAVTQRAKILGTAIRLANLLSAAMPGLLGQSSFRMKNDTLVLRLDHTMADLVGARVTRRLSQVAKLAGVESEIIIFDQD